MAPNVLPIFFTDLDGSLLDHYTYSWAAAKTCVQELTQQKIPIIPNTSKTRAELITIQAEIGLSSGFIVENGAAVFLPKDHLLPPERISTALQERNKYFVYSLARPREHWLSLLESFEKEHPDCFESFSTMSPERLVELTSLDRNSAKKALNREYGEPIHWLGTKEERFLFIDKMEQEGARVLQGGRFLHIGDQVDKGKALQWFTAYYTSMNPEKSVVSIALGDGENDIDMLECADYAVIIRSPVHDPPPLKRQYNVIVTEKFGPAGWAEAVMTLLEQELEPATSTSHTETGGK